MTEDTLEIFEIKKDMSFYKKAGVVLLGVVLKIFRPLNLAIIGIVLIALTK